MSTFSHLRRNLDEHLRSALREVRVALTPVPRPRAWVFIIGCYNSGTTLLSTLLDAHPEISALPTEGQFITDQFVTDSGLGLSRMWRKREDLFRLTEADDGPDPKRIKKEWGFRLDRSKPFLLEKSPPNTPRSRWLQAHFDNAHFVAMVRNPYAVAEGIVRKGRPHHPAEGWTLTDAAEQWRRSVEVILEDETHLERLLWVRYEDVVLEPEAALSRITQFIGARPFEESFLPDVVKVHEREQGLANLNAESIRRLSEADLELITGIVGPYLDRFGYAPLPARDEPVGGDARPTPSLPA